MKRVLALLGINVAAAFLAGVAFIALTFRDDPILASIPAIFALPAVLVQPWSVPLAGFAPGGLLLAPVWTTAVSVLVYRTLNRMGKVERIKLAVARFKSRRAVLVACAFAAVGIVIAIARYVDFPPLRHGVPRTLTHSTRQLDLNLGAPRYYCLSSFIDSEWLWQTELSGSELGRLAGALSLAPLTADEVGDAFHRMPPYWWHPEISAQSRVLATPGFPMDGRGPDGWHALAVWNPEDRLLHMWIKDNF